MLVFIDDLSLDCVLKQSDSYYFISLLESTIDLNSSASIWVFILMAKVFSAKFEVEKFNSNTNIN